MVPVWWVRMPRFRERSHGQTLMQPEVLELAFCQWPGPVPSPSLSAFPLLFTDVYPSASTEKCIWWADSLKRGQWNDLLTCEVCYIILKISFKEFITGKKSLFIIARNSGAYHWCSAISWDKHSFKLWTPLLRLSLHIHVTLENSNKCQKVSLRAQF